MKKLTEFILEQEKKKSQKEYDDFFNSKLKKYGVESPAELSDEDKKKFFDEVDKGWDAKNEEYEEKDEVEEEEDVNEGIKSFSKVKKGDKVTDYDENTWTVLKTGKVGTLLKYDSSEKIEDGIDDGIVNKMADGVAVKGKDGTTEVFVYEEPMDKFGGYVNESLNEGLSKYAKEWRSGVETLSKGGIVLVRKGSGVHKIEKGGKEVGQFQNDYGEWLVTYKNKQEIVQDIEEIFDLVK